MKTPAVLAIVLAAIPASADQPGENQTETRPVMASLTKCGGLALPDAEIDIEAYAPGWSRMRVKPTGTADGGGNDAVRFEIEPGANGPLFRGSSAWTLQPDGSISGHVEVECLAATSLQCLSLYASVPDEPPFGRGVGKFAECMLPVGGGRELRARFGEEMPVACVDDRKWDKQWTVRIGKTALSPRQYAPGERFAWDLTLTAEDGFAFGEPAGTVLSEGPEWVRIDFAQDILPGSALDFSGQGLRDAPAGKHGWLRQVGGHFEFERLPGVEQRFCGANLGSKANFPDHATADRIVGRLVRAGYNSVRIHHHDGGWKGDDIDRLDYLLAKCYEAGLYVTTDLYVSRPVPWRDIGIDRAGNVPMQLFKTYVGIHDGAFSDWCRWTQAFLEHVNPYTGRANKDEPGMPLIALVNEGKLGMGWSGKAKDPVVKEAWREYCASGGTGSVQTAAGAAGSVPPMPFKGDAFDDFDEWINRRVWERCSAFVRSLGCRALLANDNNGRRHGEGEGLTPLYDYVDCHFYVDHPQFVGQEWALPVKIGNSNPVKADSPAIFHRNWSSAGSSKPYCISEWNFCAPGRYRGMGGLLVGSFAAAQRWDGIWRFAYSHRPAASDDGNVARRFFDSVLDPLMTAGEYATVCLFLRGDATRENVPRLDRERGSLAVATPRTCGGFAESGRVEAGPLSFEIAGHDGPAIQDNSATNNSPLATRHSSLSGGRIVPTTLWASSLDGAPLASSRRILLVHLTDVQGEGVAYADSWRRTLQKWGGAPLVEAGAADVELRLDDASDSAPPTVWALDTTGKRIAEVPSSFKGGTLLFRVSTAAPEGGRIYYEIAREP